jgi:phage terminase large subunit
MVSSAFAAQYSKARANIFDFCKLLSFSPTTQQSEALACVQMESELPPAKRKKRIAVKSGQGPGKTTIAAIIAAWRTLRHRGALTIVTAPTQRQVRDIFMAELSRLLSRAHPELQRKLKVDNFKMVVVGEKDWGIKAVTSNDPKNVQGYHESNLTYVFDEASGIDAKIWETVSGTLTNENSLFLAIGNPNDVGTAFHACFTTSLEEWHTFTWNAEEAPHVDKANLRRLEREYGRDSDVYRVRVLGEFPKESASAIFSMDDLLACTKVRMDIAARQAWGDSTIQRAFGIDLARYGSDESVIVIRRGRAALAMHVFVKREPQWVLEEAMRLQGELGWANEDCVFIVDAGGVGQGALATLYSAKRRVFEFTFNSVANSAEYKNRITEAWFELRKGVRERSISLIKNNRSLAQLSGRRYNTKKGVVAVEDKDEYKKRIGGEANVGESPDRADATVLAFYPFPEARTQVAGGALARETIAARILGRRVL